MEGHFLSVCARNCSLAKCYPPNFRTLSFVNKYLLVFHKENLLRLSCPLSTDHRKRVLANNNISYRHVKQSGFLDTVLPTRKHLRLKQTHNRIKETQEKLKKTQQRLKESKQRIIEDIRDTKTMMKERMENIIERENIWTVPNVLCVTRIVFSPYLGYLIVQSDFNLALGLLVVAGITDAVGIQIGSLDGWIARTWKSQSSKLGSFLDPMADKVLIATLFLSLTYVDLIPVALTSLIVARDAALVGAGSYIRYKSLPHPRTFQRYFDATHATAQLAPTGISKFNTLVQLALVACTLGAPVFHYVDHTALHGLWYLTAGTTVASAMSYIFTRGTYRLLKPKKL
ncbi:putative cardiolipin synthase (CMP-forming) [Frankliniella fusca]|uniref:cardiolipin synthase (CMP-forming) n=1 Tax=Frankliniella fusca TaxID=407009 RepID=A0AAE1LIA7_9NEOP|nr:putative cardiolipin synthase (CMP-forming) [Frankliniella fusca]KAK3920480.1 putative cardiolipin synthase (CMP-forming) [Frankliniella fusca]